MKQLTVGEVLDFLNNAIKTGKCSKDTLCETDGCDCIGELATIEILKGTLYFAREIGAVKQLKFDIELNEPYEE
jgi:hypothetical protein